MACPHCGAELAEEAVLCGSCGRPAVSVTLDADETPTGPVEAGRIPGAAFAPGESFGGRYTIVEEVGAGGMGQVYKAIDRKLGSTVALKLIRPAAATKTGTLERFRRELALAQKVTHVNVCRVHDLGEVEGTLYISMEFIEGQGLDALIQSVGHLSPSQTITLGRQMCAGLQAIHEQAIVHRDLKPGNVMVDRSGHALVMDFGMAYRHGTEKLTRAGAVLGTLAYLSPEQARGLATDARSDIYAVGLILFEMLTGRRAPGDAAPVPLALRGSGEHCPPPSRLSPEVPAALDGVVLRCLERDPVRRYGSVAALEQALQAAAAALPSTPSGPILTLPLRKRGSRALTWAAVAVAATTVVVALTWRTTQRAPREGPVSVALQTLAYEGPPEDAYLQAMLPVVLAGSLRGAPQLTLAPYASSRGFEPDASPRAVAEQLGVGYVVQGRLRLSGGRFEWTLRLLQGSDAGEAWSETASGELAGLVSEAEGLARRMAAALGSGWRPRKASVLSRSPAALAAFVDGRRFLEGWDVERNYARAQAAFRKAIIEDPRFAEAHALLAMALWTDYRETREPARIQEAASAARRSLALSPDLPEAHAALGVVELAQGRSAEAARAFQEGLELAPADDALCRLIASAYAALGRDDEAERMFRRAIELRPSYWHNYNAKGSFDASHGRLGEAREMFRRVIQLHPESDTGYTNLAAVHIYAGEHREAEPLLLAALKLNPSVETRNNLGVVYYATGRFEEAAREWRAATETGAQEAVVHSNLGDALRQLGRPAEARHAYERAVELGKAHLALNPRDAERGLFLAMALAGLARCDEARAEVREFTGGVRVGPTVSYYAAIVCALCGDRAAAVAHAARAIEGGVAMDVRTNPDLKSLLDEPRIRRLLKPSS